MLHETHAPAKRPVTPRWLRFRLRSLLIVVLMAASFSAGWVAHRTWHRRNLDQTISHALDKIDGSVQIERIEKLDVMILKGSAEDVGEMQKSIRDIETAAGE